MQTDQNGLIFVLFFYRIQKKKKKFGKICKKTPWLPKSNTSLTLLLRDGLDTRKVIIVI